MARSAVEQLAEDDRALVEGWLREMRAGRLTMDGVKEKVDVALADRLGDDTPSRSSLHRHSQKVAVLGEKMRRSQAIADQLVAQAGPDISDGKGFQVISKIIESLVFDTVAAQPDDKPFDPENLMMLCRAVGSLVSAQKTDTDRALRLKAEFARDASKKLEKAVTTGDMQREAMLQAKRIMGFD